jgi:hypothetical protein
MQRHISVRSNEGKNPVTLESVGSQIDIVYLGSPRTFLVESGRQLALSQSELDLSRNYSKQEQSTTLQILRVLQSLIFRDSLNAWYNFCLLRLSSASQDKSIRLKPDQIDKKQKDNISLILQLFGSF